GFRGDPKSDLHHVPMNVANLARLPCREDRIAGRNHVVAIALDPLLVERRHEQSAMLPMLVAVDVKKSSQHALQRGHARRRFTGGIERAGQRRLVKDLVLADDLSIQLRAIDEDRPYFGATIRRYDARRYASDQGCDRPVRSEKSVHIGNRVTGKSKEV